MGEGIAYIYMCKKKKKRKRDAKIANERDGTDCKQRGYQRKTEEQGKENKHNMLSNMREQMTQ